MDSLDYNKIFAFKTKQLAITIIKELSKHPYNEAFGVIRKQIFRSSTSMATNYRAMCRARSKAERFSKISIVIEETDETLFWLEMLEELEYVQKELLTDIKNKTEEILKVTSSYRKMLKS
ncbi:four helix bundle protein [Chryseobacterium rhizosphaerae]|uniref:Four helix bundle protein n=2 Tax=Chryseobacterium rhizosphaerae TaxID=395937 RepID=A0ABX9ISP6_9FLAO|nr:four helix bundle protein [Chryseobacterium rhizosphaerae]REC78415.1 four helix bundle protein [Chryseobacterium rhizosphaerae]